MRAQRRTDHDITVRSHLLFYDYHHIHPRFEESLERKRNARLVLRFIRGCIGDDRFMQVFETSVTSVQECAWPPHVVSALSKDNDYEGDEDDNAGKETDTDHHFALNLELVALKKLQRLHEDGADRPEIEDWINEWASEHDDDLRKSDILAQFKFSKYMFDYALVQGTFSDQFLLHWADRCRHTHFNISSLSLVKSVDEGEFADSLLRTVKRFPDSPYVETVADSYFSSYERFGMAVHAMAFARGMLEIPRPHSPNSIELSSKWEQRYLGQKSRQALWQKAGGLAQAMLRAYFEYGSLCESLPEFIRVSQEKQRESVAPDFQRSTYRLLKDKHPVNSEIPFLKKLSRGLLEDARAQSHILESMAKATRDANGKPIHARSTIRELESAIESWSKSHNSVGSNQNRKSTRFSPTYNFQR